MGNRNDIPESWSACSRLLGGSVSVVGPNGRRVEKTNKPKVKVCNNTTLRFDADSDSFLLRLHDTDVVEFHRDGTKTLDSGGFMTSTTKDRINRCLGETGRVWSKNFEWFIRHGGSKFGGSKVFFRGVSVFTDGMRVAGAEGRCDG